MKPAALWDMRQSDAFRHALTSHKAIKDELWGWPLYGFAPNEILSKACCAWADFIGTFVYHWNDRFHYDPHPEIVKQARSMWKRYSMTGYEAFVTVMQKAAL